VQGYRAQAEEKLGTQKKRGFGGVVKDILIGLAGGGVGGAILGGVKGGDYRRENQITATAGDLREADQVQRQNQIDTDTRDRYADQREDLLIDRDSRQRIAEAEEKRRSAAFDLDQQIKQQQLKNVQEPNFDMVAGYDDDGGFSYFKKTPAGVEKILGIRPPEPTFKQNKIPDGQVKAQATARALARFKRAYPQGFDNPQWQGLLDMAGYDRSKAASDPANVAVINGMRYKFPNLKEKIDPTDTDEYKEILAQETSSIYNEIDSQSRSSSPGSVGGKNNTSIKRSYTPNDLEKYKQNRDNPIFRKAFQAQFGEDPEQVIAAGTPTQEIIPPPAQAAPLPKVPPSAPAKAPTKVSRPIPQAAPPPKSKPQQNAEVGKYVWAKPQVAPPPAPQPTEGSKPAKYDPEQTRLATEEYERVVTNQNLPPKSAQQVYNYLRKKYPNAKYISKQEALNNKLGKAAGMVLDPNAPENEAYFRGVK